MQVLKNAPRPTTYVVRAPRGLSKVAKSHLLESQAVIGTAHRWRKIAGFEATAYAWRDGEIVWAGRDASTDHPRNASAPWRPEPMRCDATRLRAGAVVCEDVLPVLPARGLLLWLMRRPLPFPLDRTASRFDAVRDALLRDDISAFESAALRVLGLGDGLTPSGDDFLGGIFFALAHAPRIAWHDAMEGVKARILEQAKTATHVISAAWLADSMNGASYRVLHSMLDALQSGDHELIEHLAHRTRMLVVTEGAEGCVLHWHGDRRRFRAPEVREVDATGAGDVFAAAFFIRLHATRDPWEAARFATLIASHSVTRPGLEGIPTRPEIESCLMEVLH